MTPPKTVEKTKDSTEALPEPSPQYVLSFDGQDDFIYVGSGSTKSLADPQKVLNLTQTTTLECWVNLNLYKISRVLIVAVSHGNGFGLRLTY